MFTAVCKIWCHFYCKLWRRCKNRECSQTGYHFSFQSKNSSLFFSPHKSAFRLSSYLLSFFSPIISDVIRLRRCYFCSLQNMDILCKNTALSFPCSIFQLSLLFSHYSPQSSICQQHTKLFTPYLHLFFITQASKIWVREVSYFVTISLIKLKTSYTVMIC